MENKPFIFGVATSGDNFTDREKETERLFTQFPAWCKYSADFASPLG